MAVASGSLGAGMIRPLRQAHLRIWVVLAIALYAVLVAGVVMRRSATPPNAHWDWSKVDER